LIVLDTNVVSEPISARPSAAVIDWLDRQAAETLFLTSVSLAELLVGVEILPLGKRRNNLGLALAELLTTLFAKRILVFDERAARTYAALFSIARTNGRPISFADAQIASIAQVHGYAVATRDARPFLAMGASVVDPWTA
jgi:predicted nucleic acid-binding protein